MIAICNNSGAFLYNCSMAEADERLKISIDKEKRFKLKDFWYEKGKGCLHYDELGNTRGDDGMCGWLFLSPDLIHNLSLLQCEAIYLRIDNEYFAKYYRGEFNEIDKAYQKIFSERTKEKPSN